MLKQTKQSAVFTFLRQEKYIILILLAAAILYFPSLFSLPSLDDFYHLSRAKQYGANIFMPSDGVIFRPVQILINGLNFSFFNYHVYISTGFNIGFFLINILLLYRIAVFLFDKKSALFISFIYALHTFNVSAVIQMDTLSQNINTTAFLALFYWIFIKSDNKKMPLHLIISFLLFLLNFFAKESSLGLVFVLPAVYFFWQLFSLKKTKKQAFKTVLLLLLPLLTAFFIYLLCRYQVEVVPFAERDNSFSGSRYGINLNFLRIFKNFMLMTGSVFFLGNSLDFFTEKLFSRISLVLGLLLSLLFFLLALISIIKKKKDIKGFNLIMLAFFFIAAVFPSIVMVKQVSELYAALLVPFYTLLMGYLITKLLPKKVLVFLLIPFLLLSVYGIQHKIAAYSEVGRRSFSFKQSLEELPQDRPLKILFTGEKRPQDYPRKKYSVFYVHNTYLLKQLLRHYINPQRGESSKIYFDFFKKGDYNYLGKIEGYKIKWSALLEN